MEIVKANVRYGYEQMQSDAQALSERHNNISIGSVGSSAAGRRLLLLRLGSGKKKLLLAGAHHAREYITAAYLMKLAEVYAELSAYADASLGGYNISELLRETTLYIAPMVNPDGVELALGNIPAPDGIALTDGSAAAWKANIRGVDLNRNYPCLWKKRAGIAPFPASRDYPGAYAASEPETRAIMALCNETRFELAASFHTKGELIYWADENTPQVTPKAYPIAQALSAESGYALAPVSARDQCAGLENWFRAEYKRPAFCIELTPSNGSPLPYPPTVFDEFVWKKAAALGAVLANAAALI